MSNVSLTISPVVNQVTVSPVQPALTISGVTSIPSGPVGGDLAGSLPNPTVDGLRGRSVAATAPTDGQFLRWNDALSQWEPATVTGGSGTVTSITAGTGLTGGTITTSGTIAASFGTTAGSVCEGNDARLAAQTITLTGDVTGSGTGSFAATIANDAVTTAKILDDAVTLAKIENIATSRLLGNSVGVSASPNAISVSSPLGFNGVSGNLEFVAPGTNGQVYFRSGGALTTSANLSFNDATDDLTLTNNDPRTLTVNASGMGALAGFYVDTGGQSLILGDAFGANDGTSVTIDDATQDVSVSALTVNLGSADLTAGSLNLLNGEFIRNTVNGRVDIMPAPHPSDDRGIYFDLTSSAVSYIQIGTINSAGTLNTSPGIQFACALGILAGTSLDFGNTGGLATYWASGVNPGAWHFAPYIGSGHAGSLCLVSQSGNGAANRRPATAHTDPTLYCYAAGTSNANDFVRVNHNATNGTVEAGRGKLTVKGASAVRIESSTGGFDLPATAGSSGQVLTTNGTNASWQTPTGGGLSEDDAVALAVAL